jgi:hypothetical protein
MIGAGVGVVVGAGVGVGVGIGAGVGVGPIVGPMAVIARLRSIFPFISPLLFMSFPFNSDFPVDFAKDISAILATFPIRLLCSSDSRIPEQHYSFNDFSANSGRRTALNAKETAYLCEESTFLRANTNTRKIAAFHCRKSVIVVIRTQGH